MCRYLRAATADELLTETIPRAKDLDEHAGYLAERWEQCCTNAVRLTTELRERGYRGSARTVRRLLQARRDGAIKPTAVTAVAPKPREVKGPAPQAPRQRLTGATSARVTGRAPTYLMIGPDMAAAPWDQVDSTTADGPQSAQWAPVDQRVADSHRRAE